MASGLIGPAVADHDVGTGYQPPEDCQGSGFNTTPRLPNSPWQVHDPCRPHPPVVDPGKPAFPDPPDDATVLIEDGDNGQISLDDWNDSSNGAFVTDAGIADGEWHHLVYRHAPGENVSEIYIDGTPATSSRGASESSSSTDGLAIASKSGTKDWLGGMLADVRLYNRALSQVEIYGLYQYDGSTGGSQPPAVVGDSKPTDPDGDGKYEDIDGDGETEYNDVVDFFDHFDDDSVQNNPDAYDFNDNDRFDDLVELFRSL